MRIKFNSVPVDSKDMTAARVLFRILDYKLNEEVRTKRSLSYGIYAQPIFYSIGIGMLIATTSQPKETLDVVATTIKDFLKKPLSQDEVEEYKNIYETAYFLTLEEHSSLCNALGSHLIYKNEINSFYDFPRQLEIINAEELHTLAKKLLKDFRMGVVYKESKFDPKWSSGFLSGF